MNKKIIIPIAILFLLAATTTGAIIYYFALTATGNVELSLISADSATVVCEQLYDGDQDALCATFNLTNQNNVAFQPVFGISTDSNAVNCFIEQDGNYIPAGQTLPFDILCSPQRMYQGEYTVTVTVS